MPYNISMSKSPSLLFGLLFILACNLPQMSPPKESTILPTETNTIISTDTSAPISLSAPTQTQTPVLVATERATATQTLTSTPTIIPTYTILRGQVLERANCRYGPGAPYLYKYGLVKGSNLEIIGRLDDANWIQIQAIGGNNPCWVKASLMEVKGDVFSVEPIYPDKAPLPVSPYYSPLSNVNASRQGDQITITWTGQALVAGDEEFENAPLYLAEVWACENGEIKFSPYGLWEESLTITDEAGCSENSRARIYFSEKHGYAGPAKVEFPR